MREFRYAFLAALAGALILIGVFSKTDPAGRFPVTLTRAQAIRRAAEVSEKFGVKTAGWRTDTAALADDKLRAYREQYPDDPAARLLAPLAWGVLFTAPDGRIVRVQLAGDGRPMEWAYRKNGSAPLQPPNLVPESVLADFAAVAQSQFKPVAAPAQSNVERQSWEWSAGERFPLVAQLDISRTAGEDYSITLDQRFEHDYKPPTNRTGLQVARGIVALLHFIAFCLAVYFALAGWSRGNFTWKAAAALAGVLIVWGVVLATAGSPLQEMRYHRAVKPTIVMVTQAQQQGFNVGVNTSRSSDFMNDVIAPLLSLLVFCGAASAVANGRFRGKWESFELALRGKLLTRQAARPIALGSLYGIGAAAIPYLAAWIVPGASLWYRSTGVLVAPAPPVEMLHPWALVSAIGVFGFAWPCAAQMKRRWLRLPAIAIVAATFCLSLLSVFDSLPAALLAGTASAAAWFLIYRRIDLLATASAMFTAATLLAPAVLLAQPVAALRVTGVYLLAAIGAGIAISLYHTVRGRDVRQDVPDDSLLPQSTDPVVRRSSRERLEAEFQVARQAQQDALPPAPPLTDGYSLAGSCEPAKQVGGDLYDYFPLPDGRLGIAVADVSGKGVPAALYMMVTKGLLAAATQDSDDLAHILRGINAHLFRACKRKVFVTMAALAVDPGGRTIEYARAGHNPIVWRRTRRGQTLLVKPGGLGLGLCGSDQFARSLRPERMELEPGDAVILYSDGITEAINGNLDQFGEDRLIRSVEQTDGCSAEETRAAILSDLAAFTGTTPARDDVTLVALRVAETKE